LFTVIFSSPWNEPAAGGRKAIIALKPVSYGITPPVSRPPGMKKAPPPVLERWMSFTAHSARPGLRKWKPSTAPRPSVTLPKSKAGWGRIS